MSDAASAILARPKSYVAFTDEQLQGLEAAHGRIALVTGKPVAPSRWSKNKGEAEPPWGAVFRAPISGESDAFEGASHNDRTKPSALRDLAKKIVVGVSFQGVITLSHERRSKEETAVRDAWDKLRALWPGAHIAAQHDIMDLLGAEADEVGKE